MGTELKINTHTPRRGLRLEIVVIIGIENWEILEFRLLNFGMLNAEC